MEKTKATLELTLGIMGCSLLIGSGGFCAVESYLLVRATGWPLYYILGAYGVGAWAFGVYQLVSASQKAKVQTGDGPPSIFTK